MLCPQTLQVIMWLDFWMRAKKKGGGGTLRECRGLNCIVFTGHITKKQIWRIDLKHCDLKGKSNVWNGFLFRQLDQYIADLLC